MNTLIRAALIVALCCLIGCDHGGEERAAKKRESVSKEFLRLKKEGLLPGLAADATGGDVSVFRVEDFYRTQGWFAPLKQDLAGCANAYCANVTIKDRKLTYTFCLESDSPRLVGSYEQQNGSLAPMPKP